MPDSSLNFPSEEDLFEIATETLELSGNAAREFTVSVLDLAAILDELHREGITPHDARRRVLNSLKRASNALHTSCTALDQERALFGFIATDRITEELGSVLSIAGVRRLISSEPFFTFDAREVEMAGQQSRDGGAEWVMREMQSKIQRIVADHPSRSLIDLLKLLRDSIDAEIEIQSLRNRGRPSNYVRDYILEHLLDLHRRLFDMPATTTPGGHFGSMCEAVLESLGQSDAGLASAMERILRRERGLRSLRRRTGS